MNAVSAGVKRPPSEATACPLSGPRLVYAGAGVDTIVATGADRPLPGAPSALTGRTHALCTHFHSTGSLHLLALLAWSRTWRG